MIDLVGKKVIITDAGKIYPSHHSMAKKLKLVKWKSDWNHLYHEPEKNHNKIGFIVSQINENNSIYYGIDLGDVEVVIGHRYNSKNAPFDVIETNIFLEDFFL